MRNRLIAAASSATIVVEAGARSGSLNTAGHAAQLGRPLGAVPGPITSKASEGCHRLIREYAATCVTTPDEMAELADPLGAVHDPAQLGSAAGRPTCDDGRARAPEGAPDERVRAELSAPRGRSVSDLAERTGLDAAAVIAALGRLSALSAVEETDDGWRRTR